MVTIKIENSKELRGTYDAVLEVDGKPVHIWMPDDLQVLDVTGKGKMLRVSFTAFVPDNL